MVRHYFHADVDHAFNFCGAANWTYFRIFRSEAGADKVTVAINDPSSGRTAGRSAKPGTHTEIALPVEAGRPCPIDGDFAARSIQHCNSLPMKNIRFLIIFLALCVCAQAEQKLDSDHAAHKALAIISGQLHIPGLAQPVNVLRDRWGVAHIYAKNQHDLFFAQGVVAAQDRLFQMEIWKRAGQGRLAETLGPSALARDVNARALRYRGDMRAEYESYAPDTQAILTAFTDGINSYISSLTAPGGQRQVLPFELQLAGFSPDLWHPEDCLNRMAAFSMTGNAFSELQHAHALSDFGAKAASLFDFDPAVALDPDPQLDLTGLSPELLKNLVGNDHRIEFPAHSLEES